MHLLLLACYISEEQELPYLIIFLYGLLSRVWVPDVADVILDGIAGTPPSLYGRFPCLRVGGGDGDT